MKINCPNCQKHYDLSPDALPSPKFDSAHASWGWKFECGACDNVWWIDILEHANAQREQRNGTNDNLSSAGHHDETDKYYHNLRDVTKHRYTPDSYQNTHANLPVLADFFEEEEDSEPRLIAPTLPKQNIAQALRRNQKESSSYLWFVIAFLLLILAGISYMFQDVLQQRWLTLKHADIFKNAAQSLPLKIQNVHWDKATKDNGTKIAVIGEIINTNDAVSRLRPLHLIAWGPCDMKMQNGEQCAISGFEYKFKKNTILQQERISFQATWDVGSAVTVTSVNVTLLP